MASMEAYRSIRYAPMNCSHVPVFPSCLPRIDWQTYFPKFNYQEGDDAVLHLIKFHRHIYKLVIKFHEDFLMKMFMDTLVDKDRSWYKRLKPSSLYSLKYFHIVFL